MPHRFPRRHFQKEGFTLIELLVVVSIIGLLASIIMASLSTARAKALDAELQSDFHSIQTQAAFYYNDHNGAYGQTMAGTGCGTFPPSFLADSTIQNIITTLGSGGHTILCSTVTNMGYVIVGSLLADPAHYWCIDGFNDAEPVSSTYSLTYGYYYSVHLSNQRCTP